MQDIDIDIDQEWDEEDPNNWIYDDDNVNSPEDDPTIDDEPPQDDD